MSEYLTGLMLASLLSPPYIAAVVNIPVLSRQFLKHLVEENMLKFFVVVKVCETRQLYLTVTHHHVSPPPLIVTCPPSVRVGEVVKVKLSFTNPLPSSISHSVFTVQAQDLCPHREVAHRSACTRTHTSHSFPSYLLPTP